MRGMRNFVVGLLVTGLLLLLFVHKLRIRTVRGVQRRIVIPDIILGELEQAGKEYGRSLSDMLRRALKLVLVEYYLAQHGGSLAVAESDGSIRELSLED